MQKKVPLRSKDWLWAVAQIPFCVMCRDTGTLQVAHRNYGKGMSTKTSDCMTARLCMECHSNIDNGANLTRDMRRSMMDEAILRTHEELANMGILIIENQIS